MTEIRPIREAEAEDFLGLLCDVFGLDFDRAQGLFHEDPMFDLRRKWALWEGQEMVSVLTTTPLEFGWGRAYGVAGVATRESRRGEGHAGKLLERVHKESERRGEGAGLLFAKELGLYERLGFEPLDRVVRAPLATTAETSIPPEMHVEEVRAMYAAWADGHPDRLRRDRPRWTLWKWHFRQCNPFADGYLCYENDTLREGLWSQPQAALPLPMGSEWFGTTLVADMLEIPVAAPPVIDLYLMGRNVPGVPQLFMTDQF